MGYYTHYTLNWVIPEEATGECEACGAIHSDKDMLDATITQALGDDINGMGSIKDCLEDSCKWYEHDTDMLAFSKKFPSILFKLRGEGEEAGDVWLTHYLDGKQHTQRAEIKFDPFDASKLI